MLAALVLALFAAVPPSSPADDLDVLAAVAGQSQYVAPAYVLDNPQLAQRVGLRTMTGAEWTQAQANYGMVTVVRPLPPEYIDATHARASVVVITGSGHDWTARSESAELEKSADGWHVTHSVSNLVSWWTQMVHDAVHVGGDVKPPVVTHKREPVYPAEARRARISGIVILSATIDKTGRTTAVEVLKPLPLGLSDAAVDAVRDWQFTPATKDGQPVDVTYNLTVNFKLDGQSSAKTTKELVEQFVKSFGDRGRVVTAEQERELTSQPLEQTIIRCDETTCTTSFGRQGEWRSIDLRPSPAGPQMVSASWWLPVARTLAPMRVGGDVTAPKLVSHVDPQYSEAARQAGVSGLIVSELIIDRTGKPVSVKILKSLPGLDGSVIEAVKQWRFSPATLNGQPVDAVYDLTTNFRLDSPADGDKK